MGTEPAPVYFLPACHRCGGRIYFGLGKYVGQEMTGWLCILGAAPFAACGFFPVPWHECGAVCLGVYQV